MKFIQTLLSLLLVGAVVQAHPMLNPNHIQDVAQSKRTPLAINEVNQSIQPSSPRPQGQVLTPFFGAARKQLAFAPHMHQKRAKSNHPALTNEDSDAMEEQSAGGGMPAVTVEGVGIGTGRPARPSRKGYREELEERGLRPRTQGNSRHEEPQGDSKESLASPGLKVTVERGKTHGFGKKRLDHKGRGIKAPDYKTDGPTSSASADASSPSATKQPSSST